MVLAKIGGYCCEPSPVRTAWVKGLVSLWIAGLAVTAPAGSAALPLEIVVVPDVAKNRFNLTHNAIGFHEHGLVRASHGDSDTPSLGRHTARDVAPDKP